MTAAGQAGGGKYLARRIDGTGEPMTGDTPDELNRAVRVDCAWEGTP
jgi:hypothetical protein